MDGSEQAATAFACLVSIFDCGDLSLGWVAWEQSLVVTEDVCLLRSRFSYQSSFYHEVKTDACPENGNSKVVVMVTSSEEPDHIAAEEVVWLYVGLYVFL